MLRISALIAVAATLLVALVPHHAGAGNEDRGYGGPLTVGPNFQKGGQHAPPVYGAPQSRRDRGSVPRQTAKPSPRKPIAREAPAEKVARRPKPAVVEKAKATDPTPVEATTTTSAEVTSEPIPDAGGEASAGPAEVSDGPVGCKKFDAVSGKTVSVTCD